MPTQSKSTILKPGQNIWRLDHARRAAVLIDGAAFFGALRAALMNARRSVIVVGWDLHSQTSLVGEEGRAHDGLPEQFCEFLRELVARRPSLEVRLLTWDFVALYAFEREFFPRFRFRWNTPASVQFRLDNAVPLGSSQHQKVIVIDDAIAFSGGLDVTVRRWDTLEHAIENPARVDPDGAPYPPFHDVQMLVDGDAARALGHLVRERWISAGGEPIAEVAGGEDHDPWPQSVQPGFNDVKVGIARTCPAYNGNPQICEVERLFLDSVEAAERFIYIENQFLTYRPFAERLAKRLDENPRLEVLIVAPEKAESWVEYKSMRPGRILFKRALNGAEGRVGFVYPEVQGPDGRASTMVHSKIMIVDDRFLRVGSANLNNRSMTVDTECDLVVEAQSDAERASIRTVRDRLIADHCGVTQAQVAAEIERSGSILVAAGRLSGNGHRLSPIDDGEADEAELSSYYMRLLADPHEPIGNEIRNGFFESWLSERQRDALLKLGGALAVFVTLTLVWHFTPLSELASLDELRDTLASHSRTWYAPPLVIGLFVAAGLVSFPLTVLIAATAAAFGPLAGLLYAGAGAMMSALVTFAIGAYLGRDALRQLLGPRLERLRKRIARRGVLAVAAIRLVPIAPFTIVNLAAGASRIPLFDYLVGTVLGLAPGLVVLSLLGGQVFEVLTQPTALSLTLLVAAIAAWIGVTIGGQYLLTHLWKKSD